MYNETEHTWKVGDKFTCVSMGSRVFTIVWGPDIVGRVTVVDDDGRMVWAGSPGSEWVPYEEPLKKTLYFNIYTHEGELLVEGQYTTLKAAKAAQLMASDAKYLKTVEVEFTNAAERKLTCDELIG